ncbi:hypothetical protein Tco_1100072 [Tanacetum coccineum]
MDHVPLIVLSDDDSDLPSTKKRNVNNNENVITKDDVCLISSDDEELLSLTERKLFEENTKNNENMESDDDEIPIRFKQRKNNKFNSMSKKRRMNCIYDSTDDEVDVIEKTTNHEVEQLFDVKSKDDSQDVHGITHQTTYNLTHSEETEDDVKVEYDSNDSFINDGSLHKCSSEDNNDSDI